MSDYTILIVDYDPRTIDSLREMLEQKGYHVEVASDGIQGIEAFGRIQPDLTLIEFMLPKKSGLEVCLELRSTPHGEKASIVIMSSRFRSRQYRSEARHQFRANEFVEKPIDHEKLAGVLDRHLHPATPVEVVIETPVEPKGNEEAEAEAASITPETVDATLDSEINDRIDLLLGS